MNIGVDFGTTYSTFARYDALEDKVEEWDFGEAEKRCIPSVVCYDTLTKKYRFGSNAKALVAQRNQRYRFYHAFKMLLPERDTDLLRDRGYAEQTPQEIAQRFLGNFLTMALPEGEQFDKMVVCVPEIWNGSSNTLDGRNRLRQLCQDLKVAKKLQIVTEPEAASAYFVYNYEKKNQTPFRGHVLTVDYGGGTLDITLTKTESVESQGRKVTRLQSLARSGRGENHDREIGAAGMAYMESVVTTALRSAGLLAEDQQPVRDESFLHAVNECEQELMSPMTQKDLREAVKMLGSDYAAMKQSLEGEPLTVFIHQDTQVMITFAHLIQAYETTIHPVLDDALNQIIALAKANGADAVDLLNPETPVLFASVGGFGKFALVEQQVYQKLGFTAGAQGRNNAIWDKRESAVALGAALVADGVLTIQPVAGHSLGIYAKRGSRNAQNKMVLTSIVNYAVRYGQPIEPNTRYYVCSKSDPTKKVGYTIVNQGLRDFLIGYDTDYTVGCLMPIKAAFGKKLKNLPDCPVAVGFSQDEDGVIWIHIHPMDGHNCLVGAPLDIRLSTYEELFETMETRFVRDGEEVRA